MFIHIHDIRNDYFYLTATVLNEDDDLRICVCVCVYP